jgi:hypothetical protein
LKYFWFSGAKCIVTSVDYRLAPENPYPAAIEDAVDSLHWLVKNGEKELGVNLNQIAVGGSSRSRSSSLNPFLMLIDFLVVEISQQY